MPPFTVASLATISTSRPETRPMPVTRPAHGASPSYMSHAASGESSRNARAGIDQRVDALAHRHLALLAMARDIFRAAALPAPRSRRSRYSVDERLHASRLAAEVRAARIDVRVETFHLPAAAVGLESAGRAAPHGVHAIHVRAAALAFHGVPSLKLRGTGLCWLRGASAGRTRRA